MWPPSFPCPGDSCRHRHGGQQRGESLAAGAVSFQSPHDTRGSLVPEPWYVYFDIGFALPGNCNMSISLPARNPSHRPPRRESPGFTLLELLVVLVILGLLVGYVGPRYFGQIGKSETKVAEAQISAFSKALDQYRLDTGHYPTTAQGLGSLVRRPTNEPRWAGPYLEKDPPLDPWGKPYVYRSPGEKTEYDLLTLGRDGQPGGTGVDADISR